MAETLSLPSIALLLVLGFLAVKYFFFPSTISDPSRSSTAAISSSAAATRTRPCDLAKVEQVAQMFPQLDRRAIAWELGRNGGSVGATTERVLVRGGLDGPPPSYQPPNLLPSSASSSTRPSTSAITAKTHQNLITRYNLSSKLASSTSAYPDIPEDDQGEQSADNRPGQAKATGWASTKTERAALLAKRREEMILMARRKMEEKDRREMKGKGKVVEE